MTNERIRIIGAKKLKEGRLKENADYMHNGYKTIIGGEIHTHSDGNMVHAGFLLGSDDKNAPQFNTAQRFINPKNTTSDTTPVINYDDLTRLENTSVITTTIYEESTQKGLVQNILLTPISRKRKTEKKSLSFGRKTDKKFNE